MDLTTYGELVVRQVVERLEVLIGFETANRYRVLTPAGADIMYAYEESGTMSRQFLGTHRPLSIHVVDQQGQPVLSANRGFYWFRSLLSVHDGKGSAIGSLKRQFGIASRRFGIFDANDRQIGSIGGSLLHRYTFNASNGRGDQAGRIVKEWGGIGREAFTDADTFRIEFGDTERGQEFRLLLLAAAFAIDLEFFESKGRAGPG